MLLFWCTTSQTWRRFKVYRGESLPDDVLGTDAIQIPWAVTIGRWLRMYRTEDKHAPPHD